MAKKTNEMSWRTTAGGVAAIVAAIIWGLGEWGGVEIPVITDASSAVAAVATGFALLFAKDNKKKD